MVSTSITRFFAPLNPNDRVIGKGDFFKAHKDTPRGQDMFGSLVVILPTQHEGGQLVLRQAEKEWTLDFTDKFASATEPSVCFVAFYGDVEHEVLPVTSGYRVTLTYNLYHKPIHPSTSSIPTPYHVKLKHALADLVNDKLILPNGGYLGFGLVHEYVHTGHNLIEPLLGQLKGSDRALGLRYSLKLLYRQLCGTELNLITSEELDVEDALDMDASSADYLLQAVEGLTIDQVEAVAFAGRPYNPRIVFYEESEDFLQSLYKDPIAEVLEITRMKSSVDIKSPILTYGNEAELAYFYGTACMLITVDTAASRDLVGL